MNTHTEKQFTIHYNVAAYFAALIGMVRRATCSFGSVITAFMLGLAPSVFGQARLISPTPGSTLAYPSFNITWQNVGGAEYFFSLGDQQGAYNYFSQSVGTKTSIALTWSGSRPADCWVRVWTRINVYSGNAGSTVAYSYWTYTDAKYRLASQGQTSTGGQTNTGTAKSALIEDFVSAANSAVGTNGGECKAFLQGKFKNVAKFYKLPNGLKPVMPSNPSQESRGNANWQWVNDNASGFVPVGAVSPDLSLMIKRDMLLALIRNARRGDVLQMAMKSSISNTGNNTMDYVPHTLLFTKDYVSDDTALSWVDSNMDNQGTVTSGKTWPWGASKTIYSLVDYVYGYYGGATLYRVRDDIQRQ